MKFIAVLSFVASALAVSIDRLEKRDSPLAVTIESVGNSAVKASITNTGTSAVKVFKAGTILDNTPIEKTQVFSGADQVAFDGIRLRLQTTGLAEDAFQTIAPGETVETEWDPAVVHDLSTGGQFDFVATGSFLTADADSTDLTGAVPYSSNTLASKVDGAAAAKVRRDFHEKIARTDVQSDCTGTQSTAVTSALSSCSSLAAQASTAATSGAAAKVSEYFKSSTAATRSAVAATFASIASECGSTTSGASETYCTDVYGSCSSGVLAYTYPSRSVIAYCPIFYSELPAITSSCHSQDRATTVLHETTHLTQVKGTQDYAYGYSAAIQLSASQAVNNADTYALFANAIYSGC